MKEIEIKMSHGSHYLVGATVSLHTYRPVVSIRLGIDDDILLTPAEAERLAKALTKAASCARDKAAHRE